MVGNEQTYFRHCEEHSDEAISFFKILLRQVVRPCESEA